MQQALHTLTPSTPGDASHLPGRVTLSDTVLCLSLLALPLRAFLLAPESLSPPFHKKLAYRTSLKMDDVCLGG